MKYILVLFTAVFFISCASDSSSTKRGKPAKWPFMADLKSELAAKAEAQGGFQFKSEEALCDILDPEVMSEIFNVPVDRFEHKTRDYIFHSPISAGCEARFTAHYAAVSKIILEMYCNEKTNRDVHVGDMYMGDQITKAKSLQEEENLAEKYLYKEISGVGDRAIENEGWGKIIWYIDNYIIYTLQYQTGTPDNSGHSNELRKMAEYITSRTLETLH